MFFDQIENILHLNMWYNLNTWSIGIFAIKLPIFQLYNREQNRFCRNTNKIYLYTFLGEWQKKLELSSWQNLETNLKSLWIDAVRKYIHLKLSKFCFRILVPVVNKTFFRTFGSKAYLEIISVRPCWMRIRETYIFLAAIKLLEVWVSTI